MDKMEIGIIRLRSALAITDRKLQEDCERYLASINPDHDLVFTKPSKKIMNVFFVQTGGSEIYFKDVYASYAEPYIIIARKENNSLAASLEIVTFLQAQGKRAFLLFGNEEEVSKKLHQFAHFYQAKKRFAKMRLGVIGTPSDWLIASNVDPEYLKKKWGVTLVNIPYKKLLLEIEKGDIDDDQRILDMGRKTKRKEDLRFSLSIHHALKTICKANKLDGFTLRCFDLLKKYQQTACLGFGLLNDDGILSGCEGDVPALLTMAMIYCLYGVPSFMANPSDIDIPNKRVTYAHCTCPLSMCEEYRLDTHFESGQGIGIAGTFKHDEVTAVKIHPTLDSLLAIEGKITETPRDKHMCRTQIEVVFEEEISKMIEHPFGNHLIFTYGHHEEELLAFFDYLG